MQQLNDYFKETDFSWRITDPLMPRYYQASSIKDFLDTRNEVKGRGFSLPLIPLGFYTFARVYFLNVNLELNGESYRIYDMSEEILLERSAISRECRENLVQGRQCLISTEYFPCRDSLFVKRVTKFETPVKGKNESICGTIFSLQGAL